MTKVTKITKVNKMKKLPKGLKCIFIRMHNETNKHQAANPPLAHLVPNNTEPMHQSLAELQAAHMFTATAYTAA